MIRSMTGFARRERQYPWGLLAWEVKTVNHRYLEIGLRLAEEFRAAESDFRQAVAAAVRRGKLDCSLHFRPAAGGGALEVDAPLLAALTARARETALAAGPAGRIDVIEMLRWPGVARSEVRHEERKRRLAEKPYQVYSIEQGRPSDEDFTGVGI